MVSKSNSAYMSNRAWFMDIVGGKDLVLCHTSALECLNLFAGYLNERTIDVYTKQKGEYDNFNYRIVDDFDKIEIVKIGNLQCTSINQTVNDMLMDFDNIDEQSLLEALSDYYFWHNKSFDGLVINPGNINLFNSVKQWAVDYHTVS